jgi:hypothetical protein
MAERKCQMIGKGIAGPVALIKDGPDSLFPMATADIPFRDATQSANRRPKSERLYKCRPTGQSGAGWDGFLLEHGDGRRSKPHVENPLMQSKKATRVLGLSKVTIPC